MGLEFAIFPGVFSPALSKSTEFFAQQLVERVKGKSVFEVGCGSGAVSILCALNGASRVVCTDLSDAAIACTNANVALHGMKDKVIAIQAEGFDLVKEHFDVLFFALPYVYVENVADFVTRFGPLAYSIFDEKYASQRAFLRRAHKFVAKGGEILTGFSMVGDQARFQSNVLEAGYVSRVVAVEREGRADNRLCRLERLGLQRERGELSSL